MRPWAPRLGSAAAALNLLLSGACAPRPPRLDGSAAAPAVEVLRDAQVADGFHLVPAGDRAYRWREVHWQPGGFERRQLYQQLEALLAGGCAAERARLPGLPEALVQVERLDARLVLYDPCNGNAPRLDILDGLVEFHPGGGEPVLVALTSATATPDGGFELVGHAFDCSGAPLTIRGAPLPEAGRYRLELPDGFPGERDRPWLTLPAAGALDALANVCREGRTAEYPFEREP